MKITIAQPELQKTLESLSGIAKARNRYRSYECLKNVVIKSSEVETTFSAFNLQWGAIASPEVQSEGMGEVSVPCEKFLKLVKSIDKKAEVTSQLMPLKGEERLVISNSVTRSMIAIEPMPMEEQPELPLKPHQIDYSLPSEVLRDGIDKTLFAARKNCLDGLSNIFLITQGETIEFLATNGKEFIEYSFNGLTPGKNTLSAIHLDIATDLKRTLTKFGGLAHVSIGNQHSFNWVAIDKIQFFYSTSKDQMPNIPEIPSSAGVIVNGKELTQSLERFNAILKGNSPKARMNLLEGKLELSHEVMETYRNEDGEIERTVKVLAIAEWVQCISNGLAEIVCTVDTKALIKGVAKMGKDFQLSVARRGEILLLILKSGGVRYVLAVKD